MTKYNPKKIESKWQKYWKENKTFATPKKVDPKKKRYILDMFPYPSGAGLHVGHPEGYTATDIYARYSRMLGKHVLHPMGWDAFGLPAENYAIKQGTHPNVTTQKNIKRFREQIQAIGLSYDWSREIDTSSPDYYKWTQWLFLLFYKHGLAYKKEARVNWCPKDNTVLANEQVINGRCERCGSEVIQKMLSQWFFKITDYAEALLDDMEGLDWPEPIKAMQRNWIGKSEGALVSFSIVDSKKTVEVFTTRPDTLFGATYLVLAPEHELVEELREKITNIKEVESYIKITQKKSELQRTSLEKEKTGIELKGVTAINPATQKPIPVWIADYVLGTYGTGAIMAVPAHDTRDFEFAKKYKLPIVQVVAINAVQGSLKEAATGEGVVINSGSYDGLKTAEAKLKMSKVFGKTKVQYKLRDWLVSRQRYWGAPIPMIYCDKCGMLPVPEKDLPVLLPQDVDFKPTGESPLVRSKKFHKVNCPKCKSPARRDSDTMDTFVDSSWYYIRFADPKNKKAFTDKKSIQEWLPVDLYVGGAEHAVMHLLYARFFAKVLHDLKFVTFKEPFVKLRNQGLILGPDGEKMSKSKGNVVNPDEVIAQYGADTLRIYEMFMGPLEDSKPWDTKGIVGVRRFLERVWSLGEQITKQKNKKNTESEKSQKELHKLIKKVTEDTESFRFNTAISAFMSFLNEMKDETLSTTSFTDFLKLLYPYAPHISEELYLMLGGKQSLQLQAWPEFDPKKIIDSTVDLIIQVNGKVKDKVSLPVNSADQVVEAAVLALPKIKTLLAGGKPKRIIIVKNKLVNIVI